MLQDLTKRLFVKLRGWIIGRALAWQFSQPYQISPNTQINITIDPKANLLTHTDPNGQPPTKTGYDSQKRPTSILFSDGTGLKGEVTKPQLSGSESQLITYDNGSENVSISCRPTKLQFRHLFLLGLIIIVWPT